MLSSLQPAPGGKPTGGKAPGKQAPNAKGGAESWLLAAGKLRLAAPEGAEFLSTAADGANLRYRSGGSDLLVSLTVVKNPGIVGDTVRKKLAEALVAKLRQEGKVLGAEIIAPAAIVADNTVLVKVIDTIKVDGKVSSRCRALRTIGVYTVEMYAIATSADDGKREALLTAAQERGLLKIETAQPEAVRLEAAGKVERLALAKARLTIEVSSDFTATPSDAAEGTVVTLAGPNAARLTVTVIEVPPGETPGMAPSDELLAATMEKLLSLEEPALHLPDGATDRARVQDVRFLQRWHRTAGRGGDAVASDSRVVRVGPNLVSVAMVTPAAGETNVAKIADALALSAR